MCLLDIAGPNRKGIDHGINSKSGEPHLLKCLIGLNHHYTQTFISTLEYILTPIETILRDYFAAVALPEAMCQAREYRLALGHDEIPDELQFACMLAWKCADAMLAKRSEETPLNQSA